MSVRVLSYASYLLLDRLLSLQQPLTPRANPGIRTAERFFIVSHQVSELLASQVFADLAEAARSAQRGEWAGARVCLTRAAASVLLLQRTLVDFLHLPVEDFLAFRGALDGASGAQSRQFADLLRGARHPLVRAVTAELCDALPRVAPSGPHRPGECAHEECAAAGALDALVAGVSTWRRLHAEIAQHFIGALPGTGGTTGVEYLLRRIGEHDAGLPDDDADLADLASARDTTWQPGRWLRARPNRGRRGAAGRNGPPAAEVRPATGGRERRARER